MANEIISTKAHYQTKLLIANLWATPMTLYKNTVIGTAVERPTFVTETSVSMMDCFVIDCPACEPTEGIGEVFKISSGAAERLMSEGTTPTEPPDGLSNSQEEDRVDLSKFPEHLHLQERDVLRKHREMWRGKLGEIKFTERRIELLPGTIPVRQMPFRKGLREREFEKAEIEKMPKNNVIRPSKSEWASPVALAPKGDGGFHFCVDYRRVNAASLHDSYTLPRMDDCIDWLGNPSTSVRWMPTRASGRS